MVRKEGRGGLTSVAMAPAPSLPMLAGLLLAGAALSLLLIHALRPWLVRYALARPSSRGLHEVPTPQGGGIAVLCACTAVALIGARLLDIDPSGMGRLITILVAAGVLAVLGLADDVRPLPALPRLIVQIAAMTAGVLALPEGTRVLPDLPLLLERTLLVVGGAWFINLTNFMDGMDWMTVVEIVPLTSVLVFAWRAGDTSLVPGLLALGLLGGLLGYAPENRPVARVFLGDVGSLPIGFLAAYGLISLAGTPGSGGRGHLAAAVLLPLYAIADSGLTLCWRMLRRQRVWEPHRSHFYQVAVTRGLGVSRVLGRVAATNLGLALLALIALRWEADMQLVCLALGLALVTATLISLSKGAAPAEV